jgi:hypothetical protein
MSIQPTSPSTGSAAIARLLPLPVGPDTTTGQWTPFAPAPLQGLHRYYEVLRPCAPHRYSGPCGFSRLDVSLGIGATGSHVPYKSLVRLRAAYMPDAARATFRISPRLSREMGPPPVSTSSDPLRHVIDGLLSLASPDRTCRDGIPTFAATLTTTAFDRSGLQWLEACT